jgi:hypothetical protein
MAMEALTNQESQWLLMVIHPMMDIQWFSMLQNQIARPQTQSVSPPSHWVVFQHP